MSKIKTEDLTKIFSENLLLELLAKELCTLFSYKPAELSSIIDRFEKDLDINTFSDQLFIELNKVLKGDSLILTIFEKGLIQEKQTINENHNSGTFIVEFDNLELIDDSIIKELGFEYSIDSPDLEDHYLSDLFPHSTLVYREYKKEYEIGFFDEIYYTLYTKKQLLSILRQYAEDQDIFSKINNMLQNN